MEYTETVEPTSIARRIMAIREQVAEQLGSDLRQMPAENARLQADYHYEASCKPYSYCSSALRPVLAPQWNRRCAAPLLQQ